jgi:hypothetical protein
VSGALDTGRKCWYWFVVPGRNSDGVHPRTAIKLTRDPPESAKFEIWTPDDLREWKEGEIPESLIPTFRGVSLDDTDLTPGKYWACVVATGRASYQLYLTTTWEP